MKRLAALFVTFCGLAIAAESFSGQVVAISDGDTLKVMREGQAVPVRLHGIDAPERKQAYGDRAKQFLGDLAFNETVTVVVKDRDRYRRLIAEVILRDGRLLNHEILRAGMGWIFVKYCKDERYYEIEARARHRRVGLWADREPTAPWEFRASKIKARSEHSMTSR